MNRLMMALGAFVIMGLVSAAPVTAQEKPAAKPAAIPRGAKMNFIPAAYPGLVSSNAVR